MENYIEKLVLSAQVFDVCLATVDVPDLSVLNFLIGRTGAHVLFQQFNIF